MIHNGIEHGLMEAHAQGFAILKGVQAFDLDTDQIADIWRDGSVVRSWLLDLIAMATAQDPEMRGIAPWFPTPARAAGPSSRPSTVTCRPGDQPLAAAADRLTRRVSLRRPLIAAMRQQFGGHAVKAGE